MQSWNSRWKRAAAVGVAVLVLWNAVYVVTESEAAIVTLFGRPVRTVLDDPGFHVKWPFEGLLRFDRRVMVYSPRPSEFLTRDKKNLVLDSDVLWRISQPETFLKTVGDVVTAEMRLHDIVWAQLAAEIGRVELSDLVSDRPEPVKTPQVLQAVSEAARQVCSRQFGIDLVDVQLKRLTFPEQNKRSVFARMRAERERIAKQYRAQGEEAAMKIRAEADKQREILLAQAYRQAEETRGHGDAESTRIYGAAYGRDPQFYKLVRTLDSYKKILDDKTSIILSSDSELLRLLTQGRGKSGTQ